MYTNVTAEADLDTEHLVALDSRITTYIRDLKPILEALPDFLLAVPPFTSRVIPFEFYSKHDGAEGYHCLNLFVAVTTKRIVVTWVLECESEDGL